MVMRVVLDQRTPSESAADVRAVPLVKVLARGRRWPPVRGGRVVAHDLTVFRVVRSKRNSRVGIVKKAVIVVDARVADTHHVTTACEP